MSTAKPERNTPIWATAGLVLLAVVFGVVAAIYFAEPAGKLPSLFPGHTPGSTRHHTKHAIAAAAVAAAALAGAWMTTGRKATQ